MKTENQNPVWKGIEVKSTSIDPHFDSWHKAYVIGLNPFTNRFIVCDESGNVKYYNEIRNADGTEMSMSQYEAVVKEIRYACERALYEVRNSGISSY